jgi:hypothetical protein
MRAEGEFDQFAAMAWPRLRWAAYLLCGEGGRSCNLVLAAASLPRPQ